MELTDRKLYPTELCLTGNKIIINFDDRFISLFKMMRRYLQALNRTN